MRQPWVTAALLGLCVGLAMAPPAWAQAPAEEDSLVTFDPLRGDIGLSYDSYQTDDRAGVTEAKRRTVNTYEQLRLRQRFTVYDPRFLQVTLGLGLQLGQGHADADGRNTTVASYEASAALLQYHPYSLFADARQAQSVYVHSPTAQTGVRQRDRNVRLLLKEELTGLPLTISHRTTEVESESDAVDSTSSYLQDSTYRFEQHTRRLSVSSDREWDGIRLGWNYTRHEYGNRSRLFDVTTETEYINRNLYANLFVPLGEKDRLRWRGFVSRTAQSAYPEFLREEGSQELRFRFFDSYVSSLEGQASAAKVHSERPHSTGIGQRLTDTTTTTVGLEHRLFRSLFTHLRQRDRRTVDTDYSTVSRDSEVGLRYVKSIPDGNIYANYTLALMRERNDGQRTLVAVDETHTLTDFTPATLDSQAVVDGSWLVTDPTGVFVYTEDSDYRIYQIGTQTYLERISGTRIANGETVLVDYQYQVPIADVEQRRRTYGVGIHWRFIEPYYRVQVRDESLQNGTAADEALLNPGRDTVYGVILTERIWDRVTPELILEAEKNSFRRDPYRRVSTSASVVVGLRERDSVATYLRRTTIDRHVIDADSDVRSAGAVYRMVRGDLTLVLGTSRDQSMISGSRRDVSVQSGGLTYLYGAWTLDANLRTASEAWQGTGSSTIDFERDSLRMKFEMRRSF